MTQSRSWNRFSYYDKKSPSFQKRFQYPEPDQMKNLTRLLQKQKPFFSEELSVPGAGIETIQFDIFQQP